MASFVPKPESIRQHWDCQESNYNSETRGFLVVGLFVCIERGMPAATDHLERRLEMSQKCPVAEGMRLNGSGFEQQKTDETCKQLCVI